MLLILIQPCSGGTEVEWSCKWETAAVMDVFSSCCACFLMLCRCLHCVALLWHNTSSIPNWVLAS